MRYQISGKQIDIGQSLQSHVENETSDMLAKYAGRPTGANVVFSKSGNAFACETIVHLSTGLTAQARGHAHEIYAAFDAALEKMDKQLRRYKRRLKDHHQQRSQPVELSDAGSYILAPADESGDAEQDNVSAMIIAETELKIPSLSAGEAVTQMELANAPALVFRNEKHNGINVVFRREDGNISWVDPKSLGG